MAKTTIQQFTFDDSNGQPVKYERLCVSGFLGGEIHTLEIKLTPNELILAKMILATDEEKPEMTSRAANAQERQEFDRGTKRTSKDKSDEIADDLWGSED